MIFNRIVHIYLDIILIKKLSRVSFPAAKNADEKET